MSCLEEADMVQRAKRICSIDRCAGKHYGRGWCRKHYDRWVRHGDPLGGESYAFKSPEEAFSARTKWQGSCLLWTGGGEGYGRIDVGGRKKIASRYAWERTNGPIPDGMEIDHTCHTPKCVNVKHLRLADVRSNRYNRSGPTARSTTGYRNVRKSGNKWAVYITKDRKPHYFGTFEDIEDAAQVAKKERHRLFGEFAGKG